ncbi:MAG: patatin family protein [bacterium]|nr:patatin family protein [bacterium]MDY2830480.1 patatin family protein [Alphaproteobacteria bacterium]
MTPVSLVLEGGAKRGIYTAGVLDVLLENNIIIPAVFGVSAGAIHGCTYAAKQIGRSIRYNLKYGNDSRFMSLKNWLKTGNVVDTDFCYHELPDVLDPFDHKTFETSGIKFYAVCSNLETGRAEYIWCPELRTKIDYIRASASLPFFSKIVEIDGKKLLDGGICDSIPLKAAEKHGYAKNIVVLTRPAGYRKKASLNRWLAKVVFRKYPRFAKAIINRADMYNAELDDVAQAEQKGTAMVLRPSRFVPIHHMEHDLNIVREMYELGRADASAALERIKEFIR